VANLTSSGGRASDSNYGRVGVDLGAPGSSILSAYDGGYAYASGTSMAAPHVTGAVALCSSIDPAASPATLRGHVLSTTVATPSMSATGTGGRLDVGAMAAACAGPAPSPSPTPAPTPGPTPAPTPGPTPAPTPPPEASTVVVDDLSSRFVRSGSGWRAAAFGYAGHHFWSPTRSTSAVRVAKWKPKLVVPGAYRVKAKVPTRHASTRSAVYRVKTADGWVKRVRNQYKARGGWVSLGVHRLTSTPVVKLTDRTGEPTFRGRAVAFDAVKFVPVVAAAASRPAAPLSPAERADQTPAPSTIERIAAESTPAAAVTPEPTRDKPMRDSEARRKDDSVPDTDAEPTPAVERGPDKALEPKGRRKPAAAPKSTAGSDRHPRPTPAPEVPSAPAGVLVVEPADLQLVVGEEQRLRALLCAERQAEADVDASCSPAGEVEWSLDDQSAGRLVRRSGGPRDERAGSTVLIAETPAETWLTARSGSLEARARLIVVPAGR
jgi:hypothetical protein